MLFNLLVQAFLIKLLERTSTCACVDGLKPRPTANSIDLDYAGHIRHSPFHPSAKGWGGGHCVTRHNLPPSFSIDLDRAVTSIDRVGCYVRNESTVSLEYPPMAEVQSFRCTDHTPCQIHLDC